jgi:outer membrane cobalamin receptor
MRLSVLATVICLSIIGVSAADDARASIRKQTNIPAQQLGAALQTLARDRNFQIIYVSEELSDLRTQGAVGEFTPQEALRELLRGTGFTFRYLDAKTVTIARLHSSTAASNVLDSQEPSARADQRDTFSGSASVVDSRGTSGRADDRGAQRPPADKNTQSIGKDSLELEEVVVTGVPYGSMRKMDASFAISTLSAEDIHQFSPKTVADLFSATPGVWVESSGGDTGANVFVRGFPQSSGAHFATVQINGLPIFLPPSVGFIDNSALFRLDESIERVEALRGGPNPVLSNGQAGVTFNFLQKKGGPAAEGLAKLTISDFGTRRVDFNYRGPLSDDLFYSVGGFYRASPGYRTPQYDGDLGGQVEFQLTRKFQGNGELNVWGRRTKDNNTWYLPIPLRLGSDGTTPEQFPGFSAGHGTYQGNDTRLAVLETGPGQTMRVDSADGRGVDLSLIGVSLEKTLGAWGFNARASYTSGTAHTKGLVGNSPIVSLQSYIDSTVAGSPGATGIAPGSLQFSGTGQPITDTSIPVLTVGWWSVDESFTSFVADLRASRELFTGNNLTIGTFLSAVSFEDLWYLGSNMLLTAAEHGRRIDFNLNNGAIATRAGFVGSPFFDRNLAANSRTVAAFITDAWQLTQSVRADAGVRVERYVADGTQEGVTFGVDLDGNPMTLYNNNTAVLNGTFTPLHFSDTHPSWTVGANWAATTRLGFFARLNSGLEFPTYDDIANGQTLTKSIRQYELGAKSQFEHFSLFATAFRNEFSNIAFFQLIAGSEVLSSADSAANGLEIEAVAAPTDSFNIAFSGTYENGHFTSGPNQGNRIFREPEFQARMSPRYRIQFGNAVRANLFAAATWVGGARYSDIGNAQPLPAFYKIDAGVIVDLRESFQLQISGDNLTNTIGLTERDPRILGSGVSNGSFLGRPIFGRSFTASVQYNF